jgi:hypothetical protein
MENNKGAEKAISLNFKVYSNKPNKVIDFRTKKEYDLNNIDTKILVYEDRVLGWFLNYGRMLQSHHDAGFIVLQIAISQIEGMEQFRQGKSSKNDSENMFIDGIKRIFKNSNIEDSDLSNFYKPVRCGLFHDGMTRANVLISNNHPVAIEFKNGHMFISPNKFLDKVVVDFESYIVELKNPENRELRESFEKVFK